jgi:hypothetical protein
MGIHEPLNISINNWSHLWYIQRSVYAHSLIARFLWGKIYYIAIFPGGEDGFGGKATIQLRYFFQLFLRFIDIILQAPCLQFMQFELSSRERQHCCQLHVRRHNELSPITGPVIVGYPRVISSSTRRRRDHPWVSNDGDQSLTNKLALFLKGLFFIPNWLNFSLNISMNISINRLLHTV